MLVYFNNDPGCAAVADAVVFADAVRRAGGTPTRVPTPDQATGLAWAAGQKTPGVGLEDGGVLGVPDAELLGRLAQQRLDGEGVGQRHDRALGRARRAGTR